MSHDGMVNNNTLRDISTTANASAPSPGLESAARKPSALEGAARVDDSSTPPNVGDDDGKRAREGEQKSKVPAKKAKDANAERAPKEITVELPETLRDWKINAENELAELHRYRRAKLLDWFLVKGAINTCIVSCPANDLRAKLREMRDNGVYGSSMVPYLELMRDIFDTCGEYVDNLDEEINPDDFFHDEDEDEDHGLSEEDEEEEEEEDIPVVSRGGGAATTAAPRATEPAPARGASRSAPRHEEMAAIQKRFQLFQKFLGQYFAETRKEKEEILELLQQAAQEKEFDDEDEVMTFLDIMQRQNKIMIDQGDSTVYII